MASTAPKNPIPKKDAPGVNVPPPTNTVDKTEDKNETPLEEKKDVDTVPEKKESARDKLRNKANAAAAEKLITQAEKLSLFDASEVSSLNTKGAVNNKPLAVTEGSVMVSGRNVGAEQREPDWTPEQLKYIRTASSTALTVAAVNDTRRSVMDPEAEYVGRSDTGSLIPTEKAYLSSLEPGEYVVGMGPPKFDGTGSPRFYSDVVIAGASGNWLVNQWTSEWVVIEGVAQNVLMSATTRQGNKSGRRIGHHFARVGLPKLSFGPLFYTLNQNYPGVLSQVTETVGYYWVNASWGVSSFPASFVYTTPEGLQKTTALVDVMRMLNGMSSFCVGTLAISVTCDAKLEGEKQVPSPTNFGLSIKMHNAFAIEKVDFHGPPQQGSTGMMIPSRIAQKAKFMTNSSSLNSTSGIGSGIFAGMSKGLFGAAGGAPPSIKSDDTDSYI